MTTFVVLRLNLSGSFGLGIKRHSPADRLLVAQVRASLPCPIPVCDPDSVAAAMIAAMIKVAAVRISAPRVTNRPPA